MEINGEEIQLLGDEIIDEVFESYFEEAKDEIKKEAMEEVEQEIKDLLKDEIVKAVCDYIRGQLEDKDLLVVGRMPQAEQKGSIPFLRIGRCARKNYDRFRTKRGGVGS